MLWSSWLPRHSNNGFMFCPIMIYCHFVISKDHRDYEKHKCEQQYTKVTIVGISYWPLMCN